MNEERTLLEAIAAGDDVARLAYADWLEERGDVRAAWVRDRRVWCWMAPDVRDPVPGLIAALGDDSWERRRNAQAALVAVGAATVPALLDAMKAGGQSYEPAGMAGEAMGAMTREAVEPVLPALFELAASADDGIREPAIVALRAVGDAAGPALPALIRALELGYDEDHTLAKAAAVVLRSLGPRAIEATRGLLALACEDSAEAEEALAAIGPAALPILLREMPNVDYDYNTLRAVGAVERIGAAAVPLLRDVLDEEKAARIVRPQYDSDIAIVREFASLALVPHDPGLALPGLLAGLERCAGDEDRLRDRYLLLGIQRLGPLAASAAPTLRRLLPEMSGPARETAAEILDGFGGTREVMAGLVAQLEGADSSSYRRAAETLYDLNELPDDVLSAVVRRAAEEPLEPMPFGEGDARGDLGLWCFSFGVRRFLRRSCFSAPGGPEPRETKAAKESPHSKGKAPKPEIAPRVPFAERHWL